MQSVSHTPLDYRRVANASRIATLPTFRAVADGSRLQVARAGTAQLHN